MDLDDPGIDVFHALVDRYMVRPDTGGKVEEKADVKDARGPSSWAKFAQLRERAKFHAAMCKAPNFSHGRNNKGIS